VFFHIFLLFFLLASCSNNSEISPNLKSENQKHPLTKWLENFAASSPYSAANKNLFFKIHPHNISDLFSGKDTTNLEIPVFDRLGREVSSFPLDSVSFNSWMEDIDRYCSPYENRNQFLVNEIKKIREVASQYPEDLHIVLVGAFHVIDYFLETGDFGATYAFPKLDQGSEFFSRDLVTFVNTFKLSKNIRYQTIEGLNGKTFSKSAFEVLIYSIKYKMFKKSVAIADPKKYFAPIAPAKSNVILIGDIHHIREASIANEFPNFSDLKKLGYKRVFFHLEGQKQGNANLKEFVEKYDLAVQYKKLPDYDQIAKEKPTMAAMLKHGEFSEIPVWTNFINRFLNDPVCKKESCVFGRGLDLQEY